MSPQEEGWRGVRRTTQEGECLGQAWLPAHPVAQALSPMETPMAFPSLHLAGQIRRRSQGSWVLLIKR